MKKIILALLLLHIGFSPLKAEDGLVVSEAIVSPNGTGQISVDLINEGSQFIAFTFKLTLPEGISFVLDSKDNPTFTKTSRFTDHTLSSSYNESSNSGIFACLSLSSDLIQDTYGTLLDINITSDGEMVDDEFDATLSEITFTTNDETEVQFSDVTFKIKLVDGRIKFNENSDRLPDYTPGESGDVKMTRTIKKDVWNTIVLPFTMNRTQAFNVFGRDFQLAEFEGFDTEYADEDDISPDAIVVNFKSTTISARTKILGGHLYLIKTSNDIESFEVDNVELAGEVSEIEKEDADGSSGKFTGSFVKTKVPNKGLFISNNEFWYSTGKTTIKAFRGWFELTPVLGQDNPDFLSKVRFAVDDEATDIEALDISHNYDGVYTLQGIRIGDDVDVKRLPKGIYIVNGKKVMVK